MMSPKQSPLIVQFSLIGYGAEEIDDPLTQPIVPDYL